MNITINGRPSIVINEQADMEKAIEQMREDYYKEKLVEANRDEVVNQFFEDAKTDRALQQTIIDFVLNTPNVYDNIIANALEGTDYDSIDEITEELEGLKDTMDEIYRAVEVWT